MKNIIVNLKDESDLYEKYNDDISHDLINFLIRQANVRDSIEITINTSLDIENLDNLIKEGVNKAYINSKRVDKYYDNKQIVFFIIGIIFLIFSVVIDYAVINEINLIVGWVAICEVIEISINIDRQQNINRKLMKKILNCNIHINNI